ncbi:hypothetical protein KC356_g8308 [Hortaea werneckii]|nr:hypothetical protein KC356_g8308 [Hortaea werneckii]
MASTNGSETSKHSSSPGPRIASGFRSWLKTKATIKKNIDFVQEDPGGTRQSMQIIRLRHLDTVVNNEKDVLEHQNQAMKGFLASHNLDEGSANNHVHSSSGSRSDPSTARSDATVDVRYDTEVGHERTFLDVEEDCTDSNAGKEASNSLPSRSDSLDDSTESWKALDFILALEWPCRDHVHHHAINPLPAQNGGGTASEPSHNHALTATQTVYSCALEPSSSHLARKTPAWHLPHSEIEKLITLSSQLPVNDDMMTPAQIYSTICLELPLLYCENSSRGRIMEALKVPLSQKVSCFGFGAALPAVDFYAVFDSAMTAMSETSIIPGQ